MTWLIALASLVIAADAGAPAGAPDAGPAAPRGPAVAIESLYTSRMMNLLNVWPSPYHKEHDAGPVWLRAIKTPGQPNYIGMIKFSVVKAPLQRVIDVTESFEEYPKIWGDIVSLTVAERSEGRAVLEWVRPPPTFIMPEIRYTMLYVWDKSVPGRAVYRHQLVKGNALHHQDDLVVVEQLNAKETRVTCLNFFEPDVGPFGGLVNRVIWTSSMQNAFRDDIAFKARCEHPSWDLKRIADEANRMLAKYPVTPVKYLDGFSLDPAPASAPDADTKKP